ncbi:hypothetical protein DOY81_012215 [Sarcophaga bullata]|nr:hypothetical protein DOY81_012215 [Sarcophaga bullata]
MLKTLPLLRSNQHNFCQTCIITITRDFNSRHSLFTIGNITNKNRGYYKKELIGYSMEEMYSVVSDVQNYYKFVPYVKKSHVHSKNPNGFKADLIVGSVHLLTKSILQIPNLVTSECKDGRLFNYLLNEWRFSPGLKDITTFMCMDFKVAFEFKSLLHSNIANLFFDLICDQMEHAFITEAKKRFGDASIKSHFNFKTILTLISFSLANSSSSHIKVEEIK